MGLLTVAYFSPDVRSQWPERMGLPGSEYQQMMGPGQMPVLAHIRRRDLEKLSPVLPALEEAVKR